MKSSLWCLILCVGLGAAALVAGRPATAERSSVDAAAPAAPVCMSSEAVELGGPDPMCGKCGDGYCNPRCGETATSCPRDCAQTLTGDDPAPMCGKCGDGYCSRSCGETATSCPRDCGGVPS